MLELFGKAFAQAIPSIRTAQSAGNFTTFFSRVVNIALYIGGGIAVIFLIYGGIMYITAAGDQEKATAGRTAIVNAIIGIIVISLALAIVTWVSGALGGNGTI